MISISKWTVMLRARTASAALPGTPCLFNRSIYKTGWYSPIRVKGDLHGLNLSLNVYLFLLYWQYVYNDGNGITLVMLILMQLLITCRDTAFWTRSWMVDGLANTDISVGTMARMFSPLRKKLLSRQIHCWPLVILVLIMLPSPYTLCMLLLVGRISLHLTIKMFFHRIINIILSPDITTGWKGPQKRGRGTA